MAGGLWLMLNIMGKVVPMLPSQLVHAALSSFLFALKASASSFLVPLVQRYSRMYSITDGGQIKQCFHYRMNQMGESEPMLMGLEQRKQVISL